MWSGAIFPSMLELFARPCVVDCRSQKLAISFFLACFQVMFVKSVSESNFRRLGFQIRRVREESVANMHVSQKSFFIDFGVVFVASQKPRESRV